MESVLRGPTGSVLSPMRSQEIRGESSNLTSCSKSSHGNSTTSKSYINHRTTTTQTDSTGNTVTYNTTIVIHNDCKCTTISHFLGHVYEFLTDFKNSIQNWRLYIFFIKMLRNFISLAQKFAKNIKFYRSINYLPW